MRSGSLTGGSDGRRRAVAPVVLLLGADGERVVQRPQLLDRLGGEVVEDPLPGRRVVVGAGQQQVPGLRLAVALGPLDEELREVAVLGGRLLLPGGALGQRCRVAAPEDVDDRVDHLGPHRPGLGHVPASSYVGPWRPGSPGIHGDHPTLAACRTPAAVAPWNTCPNRTGFSRPVRSTALEDSPSGLWRSLGKRVGGNPSGVRISHPPQGATPVRRHFGPIRPTSRSTCSPTSSALYESAGSAAAALDDRSWEAAHRAVRAVLEPARNLDR